MIFDKISFGQFEDFWTVFGTTLDPVISRKHELYRTATAGVNYLKNSKFSTIPTFSTFPTFSI